MIALTDKQVQQIKLAASSLLREVRCQFYELIKSQLAPRGIGPERDCESAALFASCGPAGPRMIVYLFTGPGPDKRSEEPGPSLYNLPATLWRPEGLR